MDVLVEPRASIRNAIDPYLRALVLVGVLLAMLAVITILATEDADAWSTYDDNVEYGDGFITGTAYYNSGSSNHYKTYYYSSGSGYRYNYLRLGDSGTTYYLSGYMTYDTGGWNDLTYISRSGGSFNFQADLISGSSVRYRIYLVTGSDLQSIDGYSMYTHITSGYYLGTYTITSTTLQRYTVTLPSSALSYIDNAINADQENIYLGFTRYSSSGQALFYSYYYTSSPYYYARSYLTLDYDAHSPYTPSLNAMNTYYGSSTVGVSWNAVSDRPTAPNRGVYGYQVGVWTSSSYYTSPVYISAWTGSTSTSIPGLQDGVRYYFRVKARDYSGFETGWSGYRSAIIDLSPPPLPVVKQEPIYTAGTTNIIEWSACVDAGIGTSYYQVQHSTNPEFTGASTYTAYSTQYTFGSLVSGSTYYYRVRAHDALGHYTEWSVPQTTTMDAMAPTMPLLMSEPLYTQGTENTFNWHPSTDAGIGVANYRVQVSRGPSFSGASIILDTTTIGTTVTVSSLTSLTEYYCRVMAIDAFTYNSAWSEPVSSTQDNTGPSQPMIGPLPEYSPIEPIRVQWTGSHDSGIGTGWYDVLWGEDPAFVFNSGSLTHITGHSFVMAEEEYLVSNTTYYFQVTPYDMLGNTGTAQVVNTTLDGEPPTEPGLTALPEYTMGSQVTLTWTASDDGDLSGMDHYTVRVFARPASGLVYMDTTNVTTMDVPGLADGTQYWFQVMSVDKVGNANISVTESTTMDASPPTVPQLGLLPQFTAGTDVTLQWLPSVDAGIGGVEHMLEWALDPEFSVGAESTDWMTGSSYEVTGLTDGQTYYFRVKARDGFGHMSMPSALVMTTMDASPPGVPTMMEMDAFLPGPTVPVMWTPVSDGSGMPVAYQVMAYDTDEAGATPVATSPWLMDTRYAFMGLDPDVEHWFKVVSKDHLAWVSDASEAVSTTVDTAGPSEASIGEIPEFTAGSGLKVMWTAGTDDGIGGVTTRLVVYSDEDLSIPVHSSEWTNAGEASVYGLADGATFWFVVEGRDGFLNMGDASEPATTTMDASAPTVTAFLDLYGRQNDEEVSGSYADATSGVETVEVSSDGDTWFEATLDDGVWTLDIDELDHGDVWVRAVDMVGNAFPARTMTFVDSMAPQVTIYEPAPSAVVSSAVVISGRIIDDNLIAYQVAYQKAGDSTWYPVADQLTSGVEGALATWLTAGLSGGEYIIKVTAHDNVDLSSDATVTVTLKGAKLSIGATDIGFSDTHPLPGDSVKVMATVRNTGDSPAEDVTVTVYEDGTAIGEESGITVPAHGTYTVEVQAKAKEGGSDYTARATSQLYDTGDMSSGQPLNTIEEESILENSAGIIGLLALIIGVLCLVLILMMMMRGGKKEEMAPEPEEDVLVDPVIDMEVIEPEPMPGDDPMRPRTQ